MRRLICRSLVQIHKMIPRGWTNEKKIEETYWPGNSGDTIKRSRDVRPKRAAEEGPLVFSFDWINRTTLNILIWPINIQDDK